MLYLPRIVVALAGFSVLALYGQSVTILATRGNVQVEQPGGVWTKASAGMKVSEQQKIRLAEQSYVALVFPANKTRELREPGTYTIADLVSKKATADDNPYASRYTGYVLNQAVASGAGRASGKTLGAVTRSTMAPTPRTPAQTAFYPERVEFSWDRVPGSEGYILQVLDDAGQILHTEELSADQTNVTLPILAAKLKAGPCYYWRVSTRRHSSLFSNNTCFRVLPAEKAAALKKEEEALRSSIDPKSALGQALLGSFYEQNGLYGYAWAAYSQAATLEPEADGYVILRDGLSQRAVQQAVGSVKE